MKLQISVENLRLIHEKCGKYAKKDSSGLGPKRIPIDFDGVVAKATVSSKSGPIHCEVQAEGDVGHYLLPVYKIRKDTLFCTLDTQTEGEDFFWKLKSVNPYEKKTPKTIDDFKRESLTVSHVINKAINTLYSYVDKDKVHEVLVNMEKRGRYGVPVDVKFKDCDYIVEFKVHNNGTVSYYDTDLEKWIKLNLFD